MSVFIFHMVLIGEILEQIACQTWPITDENMLIVMENSTHEEHLSQPFWTNNKRFTIAITS